MSDWKRHINFGWKTIFLSISFLLQGHLFAQKTNKFKLGAKELSAYDIYDLIQDDQHNLYIASNKGVLKYDGYKFSVLNQSQNVATHSFFDFQKDISGNLFCSNLKGQILKIEEDSLIVFHEEPSKNKPVNTYYRFLNDNTLLVVGTHVYAVKDDQIRTVYELPSSQVSIGGMVATPNGGVLFFHNKGYENLKVEIDEHLQVKATAYPIKSDTMVVSGIMVNEQLLTYDMFSGKLIQSVGSFAFLDSSRQINRGEVVRYVSVANKLCVLFNSRGVRWYDNNMQALYDGRTFVKDHFVSCVYQDNEGNFLFGTFKSGIEVVPNLNIKEFDRNLMDLKAVEVLNDRLYAISSENELLEILADFEKKTIHRFNKKVSKLIAIPGTNKILLDDKLDYLYDIQKDKLIEMQLGAIKDAAYLKNGIYAIANSKGVLEMNLDTISTTSELLEGRTHHIICEPKSQIIYANNINGLYIGTAGDMKRSNALGKNFMINALELYNDHVVIAVEKLGVCVFQNGELIRKIEEINGHDMRKVKFIGTYKGLLYLLTDQHIFKLDDSYTIKGMLSEPNGLKLSSTLDFGIYQNKLVFLNQDELQFIHTDSVVFRPYQPTIKIKSIKVNDVPVKLKVHNYEYTQSKFEFEVTCPSITHKDGISYLYKLKGVDKSFQENSYENNLISYKSLSPGDYELILMAKYGNVTSRPVVYKFEISPPFWRTWWFMVLCSVVFLLIVFFYTQRRIRRAKRKSELENELNLSKLIAIQSQMNPHFIFNAINSIQDLILEEETEKSYNYVVKFSQLVRQTLNFSDKEFIQFEDELSLLQVYLEIEKLRFKDDFTFEIETNGIHDILLPPMLIQPFVENAIKHGLIHKSGPKLIEISFETQGQLLLCKVKDNGIGREAVEKIQERQGRTYQSFSTNTTARRLEIMRKQYGHKVFFRYDDLMENGKASGTEVTIQMPFKEC